MVSSFVTVRSKLIAMIFMVALFTIVPTYILSGWLQYEGLKKALAQNTLIKAKLVGEYCISPLIFEDRSGATEILKKMVYVPFIRSAILYDKYGNYFSFFNRNGRNALPIPQLLVKQIESGNTHGKGLFIDHTFCITVPVRYQGEAYGALFIEAETDEINRKTFLFYFTLLPGTLLSLGLALFLAIQLQKRISEPITHLAAITRRITQEGDVSIRVRHPTTHPKYHNEIDQLYSGFNTMLERLADRNNQLHQAQKMESVGRLAGGVAHDFNNILSVIIGHADLCLLDIDDGHMLHESIVTIQDAGNRATRLTQQLLAFSRKQIMKQEILNVGKEIDDILKMIGRLLGEDIDISVIHGREDFFIKSDRSQLEQIILNLSVNARDAMPTGGKFTIQTDSITLKNETVGHHFIINPGDYIRMRVSDTGDGIPDEVIDNIFEPFFTTKLKGKGTGLGLSTVYGIVKQNNGAIDVVSEPNHGTTFILYLPRIFDVERENTVVSHKSLKGSSSDPQQTILLVEDDEMLRKMLVKSLSGRGFILIEASDGEEGMMAFKTFDGTIDILLSDVVMPGKNGVELATELTRLSPGLKVILMSGYTEHATVNDGFQNMDWHFIHKPVTPKIILDAIRSVLGSEKEE